MPRWRTMIEPAGTSWPSPALTPRRWPTLSRPFLELEPAFLWAIGVTRPSRWFRCRSAESPDRRRGLAGWRLGCGVGWRLGAASLAGGSSGRRRRSSPRGRRAAALSSVFATAFLGVAVEDFAARVRFGVAVSRLGLRLSGRETRRERLVGGGLLRGSLLGLAVCLLPSALVLGRLLGGARAAERDVRDAQDRQLGAEALLDAASAPWACT